MVIQDSQRYETELKSVLFNSMFTVAYANLTKAGNVYFVAFLRFICSANISATEFDPIEIRKQDIFNLI